MTREVITTTIDPVQRRYLETQSKKRQIPMAQIIQEAIELHMKEKKK